MPIESAVGSFLPILYIVSRLTPVLTLHPITICCAGKLFKSHALIGCRRCSRDRMSLQIPHDHHWNSALCLEAFSLVTCQVAAKVSHHSFYLFYLFCAHESNSATPSVTPAIWRCQFLSCAPSLASFFRTFSARTYVINLGERERRKRRSHSCSICNRHRTADVL
jgi:hypothetical protein